MAANPIPLHLLIPIAVADVGPDLAIVMPRARRSLADLLKSGAMDAADALEVLRHIASGLVELAAIPILHRDLKPGNVLELDGLWRVSDFGLSRDLADSTGPMTFQGWGTEEYVAPEIWRNEPKNVKSDLYALGVIAYEMFAGRQPFDAELGDLREQHLQKFADPLPEQTPATARRLTMRLLSKFPAQRPADAREVVETIERTLKEAHKPVSPALAALGLAATAATEHMLRAQSLQAAESAKVRDEQDLRIGAQAELEELLNSAVDEIRSVVPEARLDSDFHSALRWHLKTEGAALTFEIWTEVSAKAQVEGDPDLILAGAVLGPRGLVPLANLIYEHGAGIRMWRLITFSYRDSDRGGLTRAEFPARWHEIVRPGMRFMDFTSEKRELSVDAIAELLRRALLTN